MAVKPFNLGAQIGAAADRHLARTNPGLAAALTGVRSNPTNYAPSAPARRDRDAADEESEAYVFNLESPEQNLEYAASCYRALGDDEDIIVQDEKTGLAMVGSEEACEEYFETHKLDADDWNEWSTQEELMSLPSETSTIRRILECVDPVKLKKAREQFDGWNWEKQSKVTEFAHLPGIDVSEHTPVFLGIAIEIVYASKKDGKMEEYVHQFSEESGKPVSVYAVGTKLVAICGGGMHVDDRGIID